MKRSILYILIFAWWPVACEQTHDQRSSIALSDEVLLDTTTSFSLGENTPAILMDSEALKAKFSTVFGNVYPRGETFVENLKKSYTRFDRYQGEYIEFDEGSFFTPDEIQDLGTYNIHAGLLSSASRSRITYARQANITQGYMKSLRAFLAGACEQRLQKDLEAIAKAGDTVIMHRKGPPTEDEVNEFMKSLFSIVENSSPLKGAAEFAAVFKQEFATLDPKSDGFETSLVNLYKAYCIAVGQDPRVFVR